MSKRTMQRGTIVIVILLVVALTAAAFSVWFHYQSQRRALDFWGPATANLIDHADQIEVLELGEADPSISLADDDADVTQADAPPEPEQNPDAPPPVKALEFNQVPWIVLETKDAAAAKGISNLRRVLVLDSTYDWTEQPAEDQQEPQWQYAISMNDGRNWATVLFDFDSRQVALSGGRKTVRLAPEVNEDFRQFFVEQFPPSDTGSQDETTERPTQENAKPESEPEEETKSGHDEQDEDG